MKKHLFSGEQGFTLIEAMIAILILTIGVLSLNGMQINAIKGNAKAARITYGTSWTTAQIERLISLPFDDLLLQDSDDDGNDGGDFGLDDIDNEADGSMNSPDDMYTIFWNVAEGHPMPGLKSLRIIVRYNGGADIRDITMDYVKPRT